MTTSKPVALGLLRSKAKEARERSQYWEKRRIAEQSKERDVFGVQLAREMTCYFDGKAQAFDDAIEIVVTFQG